MSLTTAAISKVADVISEDTSPIHANVYERHNYVNMTLPAITVGPVETAPDYEALGSVSGRVVQNIITLSVRIHTTHSGDYYDETTTIVTADEVAEELLNWTNQDLGGRYFLQSVDSIRFNQEFEESATQGAEIRITINKAGAYYA